jgi:hypothetical protein
VPKTKVVDTRKATNVNLDKYDERLQDMADSRSNGRRDQQQTQGKEKIRSGKKQRDNNFGNKRKQEEADRLRRLQLEVIKKTPVTVEIGDRYTRAFSVMPPGLRAPAHITADLAVMPCRASTRFWRRISCSMAPVTAL